ncbi:Uncharacterised protein [Mycobacteroides abscessus subsp. abscessus]|nr:Uncharacterised protein [Mycobacteroides abscessus subsp. abscessus]
MGTIALYDAKCHIILPDGKVLEGYGNVKIIVAHYLKN